MSDPKDTPRYDVETRPYDAGWDIIDHFIHVGDYQTTIRDNSTGREYTGTGSTEKESRDNAWDSARRDD